MRWIYGFLFLLLYVEAFGQQVELPSTQNRVPVPDPTLLTTQQLYREIEALRVQQNSSVIALQQKLETRLDAMDKAMELLQARADKIVSSITEQIKSLQTLHQEKFDSVQKQFVERDTRTEQLAAAGQLAIKDALQAAKEAVVNQNISNEKAIAKSEGNTTKLLDGLDGKIAATKELIAALDKRFSAGEGLDVGQRYEKETNQSDINIWIGLGGLLVALVAVIIAAATVFIKR